MTKALSVGDLAPNFTLPGDGGSEISLSALKGQKIVLYFYPKDDTSGCTKEAIAFNGLRKSFDKAGAVIIGAGIGIPLGLIASSQDTILSRSILSLNDFIFFFYHLIANLRSSILVEYLSSLSFLLLRLRELQGCCGFNFD